VGSTFQWRTSESLFADRALCSRRISSSSARACAEPLTGGALGRTSAALVRSHGFHAAASLSSGLLAAVGLSEHANESAAVSVIIKPHFIVRRRVFISAPPGHWARPPAGT
jgi:hypothetical protein